MSKLIPFLFSTPMVMANQAGIKTQTRRTHKLDKINEHPDWWQLKAISTVAGTTLAIFEHIDGHIQTAVQFPASVGDIIWQRETYYAYGCYVNNAGKWSFVDYTDVDIPYRYENSPGGFPYSPIRNTKLTYYKRPSLFMPYAACRARYQITNIRIQRLQDITEIEAHTEGVYRYPDDTYADYINGPDFCKNMARDSFQTLWQSINGPDSWYHNPWVIVYTYKKCAKPLL